MFIEMLTKIKNAQAVKKENVKVNYSKINESILKNFIFRRIYRWF